VDLVLADRKAREEEVWAPVRTGWRGRKTGCSFGSEVGPFCSVGGRRSRCCF